MEEKAVPNIEEAELVGKKSGGNTTVLVSLVVVAIIIFTLIMKGDKREDTGKVGMEITPTQQITPTIEQVAYGNYKDGVYDVKGDYVSPGGPEEIDVKLTLKNNVVVDSTVTSLAERPKSQMFQGQFVAGYKQYVVGKKLDEINVPKVSGSSLTPKGFNDALNKIKNEAKA